MLEERGGCVAYAKLETHTGDLWGRPMGPDPKKSSVSPRKAVDLARYDFDAGGLSPATPVFDAVLLREVVAR